MGCPAAMAVQELWKSNILEPLGVAEEEARQEPRKTILANQEALVPALVIPRKQNWVQRVEEAVGLAGMVKVTSGHPLVWEVLAIPAEW